MATRKQRMDTINTKHLENLKKYYAVYYDSKYPELRKNAEKAKKEIYKLLKIKK